MLAVAGFLQTFSLDAADTAFSASWQWRAGPAHAATAVLLSPKRYQGGADVVLAPPAAAAFHVAWDPTRVRVRAHRRKRQRC